MTSILDIDCSILEGGGQIIRNSLSLALITRQEIKMQNIRHNRPKPGLSNQHLEVARLMQDISHGRLDGAALQSTELFLSPGTGNFIQTQLNRNIGSAGAISLVLQSALPCMLIPHLYNTSTSSPEEDICDITLVGGTNVPFSPPIDHLKHIILPILSTMGLKADVDILKRGYYPIGGGKVKVNAACNNSLSQLNLTDTTSPITSVCGIIYGTGTYYTTELIQSFQSILHEKLETFLDNRSLHTALEDLRNQSIFTDELASISMNSHNPTNISMKQSIKSNNKHNSSKIIHSTFGVQIWLNRINGIPISANILYEGKKADFIDINTAAMQIIAQLSWIYDNNACIDEHTADQLIIYMALNTTINNTNNIDTSQILCAPRIEKDIFSVHLLEENSMKEIKQSHEHSIHSTSSITATIPLLAKSSLHLESAIYIAELFLNCKFTIEEVGPYKCRLITCTKKV